MAEGGALECRWRAAVCTSKCGCEVAVAGEADFEGERRQVIVPVKEVEGAGETQPELVTVKGHAFHLLEDLGEIDRGAVDFGGYVGESPATSQVGGEEEFDAVDCALMPKCAGGVTCGARSEGTLNQGNRQAFGFEGFGDAFAQAVTKHCHEGLGPRIDAQTMRTESRF